MNNDSRISGFGFRLLYPNVNELVTGILRAEIVNFRNLILDCTMLHKYARRWTKIYLSFIKIFKRFYRLCFTVRHFLFITSKMIKSSITTSRHEI